MVALKAAVAKPQRLFRGADQVFQSYWKRRMTTLSPAECRAILQSRIQRFKARHEGSALVEETFGIPKDGLYRPFQPHQTIPILGLLW